MSSGSPQSRSDPAPSAETLWEVVEIVAEDGKRYKVRWAGEEPKTGKPWPLSWVPNSHCSSELIKKWERKKAKKDPSSLASSSSFKLPQAPVVRSNPPTDSGSPTKPSESLVRTKRKRKHSSTGNTDDNPKPPRKKKPVSVIDSQPGGDLGSGGRPSAQSSHTPDRKDSPIDAPRSNPPTDSGSPTKSSESLVRTNLERKHSSTGDTNVKSKYSFLRKVWKPVSIIDSQPGGDLGRDERPSAQPRHTPDRKDSPIEAPRHPPLEEIEMWVPNLKAKFGPPKRKRAAVKPREPPAEQRTDSIVSTVSSVRPQAPLTVSKRPVDLSESQIIALREEEEESQSQPQRAVSRQPPQLGSPSQGSARSVPLQTPTGGASGEAGENSQKVRDDHLTNQPSAGDQPMDQNANTDHASGLHNESHIQNNATTSSVHGGSVGPKVSPPLPSPTRKSLVKPVPAVIASSTKSSLPERSDPRPIANSTPSSVEPLGPLKDLRRSNGTLVVRRAFEARARLELVRRAGSHSTGNVVEGQSSTSIAQQSTTQPPPHVALQQVLSGLESPSQSRAPVMENSKTSEVSSSKPREAGLSVESKEDMVNQDKSDQHVDIGAAKVPSRDNEPSPPDEVPPTTQGSTQSQSLNASSQSLYSQLATALDLLHKKSEEISELQAQIRGQPTNGKDNPGDKRVGSEQPSSANGTDRVATGVQTEQAKEAQVALDLERAQWAEERTALQSETDALRAGKAQALTDVEFFREQYQKASTFASSTRSENEDLLARATLAESQSVNGIALIRATFEARVDKLEAEVRKYKALAEMLTERARRTDDDIRYRAAIAPELERQYQRLQRQLEEREDELEEVKDELRAKKKVNGRLRRLVTRLEAEGRASGGKSPEQGRSRSSEDDEDYVPGPSPSSSPPPIEISSRYSPLARQAHGPNNEEDVTMLIDQDVERLAGDDSARLRNDDMVYLCWWRSSEPLGSCDAVMASKSELREHVLSQHLACH